MKLFVALVLLSPLSSLASAFDHGPFDAVLKKYVDRSGMVDYAALKSDRGTLDTYLKKTGSVPEPEFNGWSGPERLAFLINVYNAETLQFIIDNYPVSSIRKLGGLLSSAWDKKTVVLFGKETTLDHLEHGIIRVKYSEPRIHFALVCAAKGCPPLRREAFTAGKLDTQLADQTRNFLSQTAKNRFEGDTLFLSPIFDWYEEDFVGAGKTVNDFVDPFFSGDAEGKKVKYTDYDWSLNDQK